MRDSKEVFNLTVGGPLPKVRAHQTAHAPSPIRLAHEQRSHLGFSSTECTTLRNSVRALNGQIEPNDPSTLTPVDTKSSSEARVLNHRR